MREQISRLRWLPGLAIFVAWFVLVVNSWSDAAAYFLAFGAVGVIALLPKLRQDEIPARVLVGVTLAVVLMTVSAFIALYVIHSWKWLGFSASLFAVFSAVEIWDWWRGRKEERAVARGKTIAIEYEPLTRFPNHPLRPGS